MIKKSIVLTISSLFVFGIGHGAQWVSLAGQNSGKRPVSLSSNTYQKISLEVSLSGLEISEQTAKSEMFALLTVPGYGYNTLVGHPKLPVVSELVEIPQGATVKAFLEEIALEEINLKDKGFDKRIFPVQLPVPKVAGAEEKVPFSIDQDVYSGNDYYVQAKVTVSEPMQMRGHRVVLVSFWPVSYNPVTGDIKTITKAKISLKLSGSDIAKTQAVINKLKSSIYDGILESTLINYSQYETAVKSAPALPINELIIVGDQYYDALQPLVNWDTQKGYRVFVTKTSEIPGGADTAHIRQYIKSQYDGETPPDFLLIVGDVDVVPAYITSSVDRPATDLYYSTMSGTDYLPDLYVSRISVADTTQLHNYIVKYLGYQQGQWTADYSWMQKAYLTASNDVTYHNLAEATDNYCIALARTRGMDCDSLYAYYGTGTPVADALNQGRSIVTYTGHGAVTYWDGPSFYQASVNALTNANKYPLVTSFACLTGQFTYSECFGETWIRAADKGAMAFWGSSVTSYWDEDDILQRRMYDAFLDSGYAWISGMTVKAKLDYFKYWQDGPMTKRYFEMYNILGNGAVDLYTQQPLTMDVIHQTNVPFGPATVDVNVSADGPVQNALACLTLKSNGAILATEYTDALGNASLDIVTLSLDSINISVTAHNCVPYSGQINLISNGPCVLYYKHYLVDSSGNGDAVANPGEAIDLPLWVKNYGNTISIGTVKSILRTASPLAVITDSLHNFGLIYAGDSMQYTTGYHFNVSPACTNGTVIPFTLECHDTENSWTSTLSVKISAPKLLYSAHSIIDPAPSNNNGFVEPGETDSIRITLENQGQQTAENVTAILSTIDPYITVINDSSSYGNIASDSNKVSAPCYLVAFGTPPVSPYIGRLKLHMIAQGGLWAQDDSFTVSISSPGFYDNVENIMLTSQYQTGYLWHTTEYTSYSPTTSWRCGVGDDQNYLDNMNSSLVTPEFFVAGTQATVSFWHKHWMELGWDRGFVEFTIDDGSTWAKLDSCTDTLSNWTKKSYSIDSIPIGSKMKLRFRFTSDVSVTARGWHIDEISVTTPTGVAEKPTNQELPRVFKLNRSYPNPMNGSATISYQIPQKCQISLIIYNILGQSIKTLESGIKEAGAYQVKWDGRDQNGNNAAAGIYFYRLSSEDANLTQKMILVR